MFCRCCWPKKKYLTITDIVKMPKDSYYVKAADLMMQQMDERQKLTDEFMKDLDKCFGGLPDWQR